MRILKRKRYNVHLGLLACHMTVEFRPVNTELNGILIILQC